MIDRAEKQESSARLGSAKTISSRLLAPEYHAFDVQPRLPAMAVELWVQMLLLRPADTEIGDQRPAIGYLQYPMHGCWLQDRNPAQPQSLRARREPKGLNGRNDGILKGLGHGLTAQATARLRCLIGKDRKMNGSSFEALPLQHHI